MARIYAERAYGPCHSYDDRHHHVKFPLQIEEDMGAAYAKVLGVAARISYEHGNTGEAINELRNAMSLDPLNSENEQLLKQYNERSTKKFASRQEPRDAKRRKQGKRMDRTLS